MVKRIKPNGSELKMFTLWLPEELMRKIKYFVKKGYALNASEFVRQAIIKHVIELTLLEIRKEEPVAGP